MNSSHSDELLHLLQEMIRIESVNPDLSANASGETKLANYLGSYMKSFGLEMYYQSFDDGRKNAIGVLKGSGGGKSLMFNGHIDTVGTTDMAIDPFGAELKDGKLYGRGSMDMKSGVSAMIMATKAIADSGHQLKGDIILACVGDEEYLSKGTEKLLEDFRADAAIVTEPTDMKVMLAHKGFVWTNFIIHGKAAHGSRPEVGKDAILEASYLLVELLKWENEELPKRSHPLLGRPSLHASIIKGGTEISVYPHLCELRVEWRTLPGEDATFVEEQVKDIISKAKTHFPQLEVDYEIEFERKPLEVSREAEIVNILDRSFEECMKSIPDYGGIAFWTDAALLAEAGIPSVIFGPSGKGLHGAVEYVEFQSVVDCMEILRKTALQFCK
ncbi:MAG: ArgE/DapE family deacylase [Bacteroidota bacterium]